MTTAHPGLPNTSQSYIIVITMIIIMIDDD